MKTHLAIDPGAQLRCRSLLPLRLLSLALLSGLLAGACTSYPRAGGQRFTLRLINADNLLLDGKQLSWEQFDVWVRQRVDAWREERASKPHAVIMASKKDPAQLVDRMLELLQAAGIRAVDLETLR